MLRFLFDTDHLTLFERMHPPLRSRLASLRPDELGISAISVEEALRGRLANLSRARDGMHRIQGYRKLVDTVLMLQQFPLVPYDQASELQFQRIRSIRIGAQDLKIAAVALANQLTLLTRNRRDFALVPGLSIDDWSV